MQMCIRDRVYFLSFCKSAGNPIDSQNIRHEQDFFVIQGFYEAMAGTPEEIYCGMKRRSKKQFKRNKKEYSRLSDHIGFIPLVMVSPADSELIAGGSDAVSYTHLDVYKRQLIHLMYWALNGMHV